jgi:hypothetical protein
LSHTSSPFCSGYFGSLISHKARWTICSDWLWTKILLISASWETRTAGIKPLVPGLLWLFWSWVLVNYLPRLASNLSPPWSQTPKS